jgi:hypothetical protein
MQNGNPFPFDATAGPGYVWHCHLLEHEDKEMMRPYIVVAVAASQNVTFEFVAIAIIIAVVVVLLGRLMLRRNRLRSRETNVENPV